MQTSVKAKCPPGLDMSAHILTSGYWPSYPVFDAKLPGELTQYQVRTMQSPCTALIQLSSPYSDMWIPPESRRLMLWDGLPHLHRVRTHEKLQQRIWLLARELAAAVLGNSHR